MPGDGRVADLLPRRGRGGCRRICPHSCLQGLLGASLSCFFHLDFDDAGQVAAESGAGCVERQVQQSRQVSGDECVPKMIGLGSRHLCARYRPGWSSVRRGAALRSRGFLSERVVYSDFKDDVSQKSQDDHATK